MMYNDTTIIAEYNTEQAAEKAADMALVQFPELTGRITVEDTSDEWVSRYSWAVTLANASYLECDKINDFLYTNTLTR